MSIKIIFRKKNRLNFYSKIKSFIMFNLIYLYKIGLLIFVYEIYTKYKIILDI